MNEELSKFFEHGKVELKGSDFKSREVQLELCVPCCLFLAVTPSLLGSGLIDNFKVKQPLAAWIPSLTQDRFHPVVVQQVPLIAEKSNIAVQQAANRTLQNFEDLSQFMPYPEDLIPSLPLGIYVECEYRCSVDNIAKVLLGVGQTSHHGIAEFRYALATILSTALNDIEKWERNRL